MAALSAVASISRSASAGGGLLFRSKSGRSLIRSSSTVPLCRRHLRCAIPMNFCVESKMPAHRTATASALSISLLSVSPADLWLLKGAVFDDS